ncbi:hypothetical protein MTR67_039511 [Solanum verrucosum]|uniref:Uncharacterized protein n=1 Tax=Solanum verrucosum TaxID=315347 RepID=A0AAF0ZNX9_SOLVR|nr:hypothetical protein MTR67_039511 [Solanum verrucosum]
MNALYHPIKANLVVDALSRLSMSSIAHAEEQRKDLAKNVHQLARLGVGLTDMSHGGDGLLRYQGRLCVPKMIDLRQQILTESHNSRQHDSIWVIVDRVTKSAQFLAVKTIDSLEDYTRLYIH